MVGVGAADSTVLIISAEVPALGQSVQSSFKVRLGKEEDTNVFELVSTLLEDLSQDQPGLLSPEEVQAGQAAHQGFKAYALEALDEWHARLKNAQEGLMKAERAKEQMNTMRATYFKELQQLREMVYQKNEMERQGGEFIPDEVRNFDPTEFQFDDAVSEMVQQKIAMMQMTFTEKIAEVTRSCTERVSDMTLKLNNVRLHLDKKDDLLRALMQKHSYSNEAELQKATFKTPATPSSPRRSRTAATRWRVGMAALRVANPSLGSDGTRSGKDRKMPKVEDEPTSPKNQPSSPKKSGIEQPAWRGGGLGGGRFFAAVTTVGRGLRRIGSSAVVEGEADHKEKSKETKEAETQCEVSGEVLERAMDMYHDKGKEEQCAALMRGENWFGEAAGFSRSGSTEACTSDLPCAAQRAEIACQTDVGGSGTRADSACQTDSMHNAENVKGGMKVPLAPNFKGRSKSAVATESELPILVSEEVAAARIAREERSASIHRKSTTPVASRSVADILRRHGVNDADTGDTVEGIVPGGRSQRRRSVTVNDPETAESLDSVLLGSRSPAHRLENESPNFAVNSLSALPELTPKRRNSTEGVHIVDLASPEARTPRGPKGALVRKKTARVAKA